MELWVKELPWSEKGLKVLHVLFIKSDKPQESRVKRVHVVLDNGDTPGCVSPPTGKVGMYFNLGDMVQYVFVGYASPVNRKYHLCKDAVILFFQNPSCG